MIGKSLFVLLSGMLLVSNAMAVSLGPAARFNLLVFDDMAGYHSDVEGRLAVGGDLTLRHYGVGQQLTDRDNFTDTLIVGGDLSFRNGRVYHGNIRHGGSADVSQVGFYDAEPAETNGELKAGNPLDFAAIRHDLYARSLHWGGLTANGTTWRDGAEDEDTSPGWALYLQGNDPWLNIFELDAGWLSGAYSFYLDAPLQSQVLINVDGILAEMDNFGFFRKVDGGWLRLPDDPSVRHDGSLTRRVLFNFFNAEQLSIHDIGVKASVLAPRADLLFYNGHVDGNLIVGALLPPPLGLCDNAPFERCTGQVNRYSFITEPGIFALLLPGLGMLIIRWRRTDRWAGRC